VIPKMKKNKKIINIIKKINITTIIIIMGKIRGEEKMIQEC
jgi:hypothetical protein